MKFYNFINEAPKKSLEELLSLLDDKQKFNAWIKDNINSSNGIDNLKRDFKKIAKQITDLKKGPRTLEQKLEIEKNIKRNFLQKWLQYYNALDRKDESAPVIPLGGKYGYHEDNAPWDLDWRKIQQKKSQDAGNKFIYRTPVTACFKKPVWYPIILLEFVLGLNNEHVYIKKWDKRVDVLAQDMIKNGYKTKSPILVGIDGLGNAWILEGNHRMRAANKAGLKYIPVEFQWYGCGEQVDGRWSPKNIIRDAR